MEAAQQYGYPLWLLKLSIELYKLPRALALAGATSEALEVEQTTPAGCGFATTLLMVSKSLRIMLLTS